MLHTLIIVRRIEGGSRKAGPRCLFRAHLGRFGPYDLPIFIELLTLFQSIDSGGRWVRNGVQRSVPFRYLFSSVMDS